MRSILALVAGAAVAAFGAVVLGEYSFAGPAVVGSGLLLGVFVAEAVLAVRRGGSMAAAAGACAFTAAGLLWAGWIATGHRLGEVRWDGWLAVALGGLTAAFRSRPAGGPRSRAAPARTD